MIYFLKNYILNFIAKKIKYLAIIIILFNKFVYKNKFLIVVNNKNKKTDIRFFINNLSNLDSRTNLEISKFFFKTQDILDIIFNLIDIFL